MGRVYLNNMITIQLKKQLEEKGLSTKGTKADLEMRLEQDIRKMGGKSAQILHNC